MLQDWQVVILRPKHQAQVINEALQAQKAHTVIVPLMEIVPLPFENEELLLWKKTLSDADFLIISSANAIRCAPKALLEAIHKKSFIITMGEATTQALKEKINTVTVGYTALMGSTSETVLSEPFLEKSKVLNKRIVLLAGLGGRTTIRDALLRRGALVDSIYVYQQQKPQVDLNTHIQALKHHQKVCFLVTSANILTHLVASTPEKERAWLREQRLVVVSERILVKAKTLGFSRFVLAKGAHPTMLLAACVKLAQS